MITRSFPVPGRPRLRICTKGPDHWFVERVTDVGWEQVLEEYFAGGLEGYRLRPVVRNTEKKCEDWIDDQMMAYDAKLAKDAAIKAHISRHPPREYPA